MKKIILFAIWLVVMAASSVASAGSNSFNLSVLGRNPKSIDKVETTITGHLEFDCIESNCLYLPFVVKSGVGIGSWVKYSEPVIEPGPIGDWDGAYVNCPEILFDGTQYRMWYSGGNNTGSPAQIGYATSLDGIIWEKHMDNPVLKIGESGKWDDRYIREPVVLTDGSTWKMWYEGVNVLTGSHQIGFATSQDGISWLKFDGNPILNPGPPGSWDAQGVNGPYVILKQDEYHMWYYNSERVGSIGYATSNDGFTWTKLSGNPILTPDDDFFLNYSQLRSPSVIEIFGDYNMWVQYYYCDAYSGFRQNVIHHKTSPDGINWVSGSASFPNEFSPFSSYYCPAVILHNNLVKMWYTTEQKIFYAEAPLIFGNEQQSR